VHLDATNDLSADRAEVYPFGPNVTPVDLPDRINPATDGEADEEFAVPQLKISICLFRDERRHASRFDRTDNNSNPIE
jgi:hypothetical protein